MAAACALSNAVEHGLRTRATIVDMRGKLNIRQWEEDGFSSKGTRLVRRLRKSLCTIEFSQTTKQIDNKRSAIDLSALKQLIWDNRDDCDEEVDGSKGDYPRGIDTSAILSDCIMNTMTSSRLNETFKYWCL